MVQFVLKSLIGDVLVTKTAMLGIEVHSFLFCILSFVIYSNCSLRTVSKVKQIKIVIHRRTVDII